MPQIIIPSTSANYTVAREGNKIFINKVDPFTEIFISLYKRSSCNYSEYSDIYVDEIMGEEQFLVRLPIEDGLYKIVVKENELEEEFTFPVYDNLLSSLVEDIENYFCEDCGCKGGCEEKHENRAELLTKLLIFYTINKRYVGGILDKAFECTECAMYEALDCYLYNDTIGNNKNLQDLFNKIVGTFYFAIYFSQVIFTDEQDNMKKFKYNKIKDCITLKGIAVECIKNKLDNMATFTMAYTAYVNQPPTIGNYSSSAEHGEEKVLTPAMFTTATVPAYSDVESDPADAIRIDSLPTNGAVLYLNNIALGSTGTVIPMSNIAAGKLKLKGSSSTNSAHSAVFGFSVRDTGSMIFSS